MHHARDAVALLPRAILQARSELDDTAGIVAAADGAVDADVAGVLPVCVPGGGQGKAGLSARDAGGEGWGSMRRTGRVERDVLDLDEEVVLLELGDGNVTGDPVLVLQSGGGGTGADQLGRRRERTAVPCVRAGLTEMTTAFIWEGMLDMVVVGVLVMWSV